MRLRGESLGNPVKGILHAVTEEEPNMIVMATRGQFGLSEMTKGSVTSEVIRAGHGGVRAGRGRMT